MKFGVGQPVRRRENPRGPRANGQYIDGISVPRPAHAPRGCETAPHAWIGAPGISAGRGLRDTPPGLGRDETDHLEKYREMYLEMYLETVAG